MWFWESNGSEKLGIQGQTVVSYWHRRKCAFIFICMYIIYICQFSSAKRILIWCVLRNKGWNITACHLNLPKGGEATGVEFFLRAKVNMRNHRFTIIFYCWNRPAEICFITLHLGRRITSTKCLWLLAWLLIKNPPIVSYTDSPKAFLLTPLNLPCLEKNWFFFSSS